MPSIPDGNPSATPQHTPLIQEGIVYLEYYSMIQLMKNMHQMTPFESGNVKYLPLLRGVHPPSDTPCIAQDASCALRKQLDQRAPTISC